MSEDAIIGNSTLDALLVIIASIGAFNWVLVKFGNFDLLLDGLELAPGSTELQIAYAIIGAAAVVAVYNKAIWSGWIEG